MKTDIEIAHSVDLRPITNVVKKLGMILNFMVNIRLN